MPNGISAPPKIFKNCPTPWIQRPARGGQRAEPGNRGGTPQDTRVIRQLRGERTDCGGHVQILTLPPGTYNIILMDIQMPMMDGYQATAAIRSAPDHPDAATIPIIAMTTNTFSEDVATATAAGMR